MLQNEIAEENKFCNNAKAQYSKLQKPKTCNLKTYIDIYTARCLDKKKAKENIKTINFNYPPEEFKFQAELHKTYPPKALLEIKYKIFNTSILDREKIWKKLDLPINKLEKLYIKVAEERLRFARLKGYKKYIDMFLAKYEISPKEYRNFQKNVETTIAYCNQNLPKNYNLPIWFYSNFNLPCFICRQKEFPFKNTEEVLEYFIAKYPLIKKFRNKIEIKIDKFSKMSYQINTDSFLVTLAKRDNKRHRIVDLIHELSHVLWYLEMLTNNKNPYRFGFYQRELQATRIEFNNLAGISEKLLQEQMAEVLLTLRRVLFEIQLYEQPHQDLSKLYAKTFNLCFINAKQKENPTYLIDDKIIYYPFSNLHHAVAAVKVLKELLLSRQRFSDLRFPDNSP